MTRSDIPLISAWMVADPHWMRYGMTTESIEHDLASALVRMDLLLVADADQPSRAFSWCQLNGMFGSQAYLKRIGVDPSVTGRHIGGRLLERTEELVRQSGRHILYLLVSDFNKGAQHFYQRHGYREIGSFPDLALPGVTELLYRKELVGVA